MWSNLLVLSIFVSISAAKKSDTHLNRNTKFQAWKAKYNKIYSSPDEELKAMQKLLKNHEEIEAHNLRFKAGKETFERGLWNRSDLSFEEKQKLLAGSRDLPTKSETLQAASPSFLKAAPSSLNWTQAGLVHEVQDQQQCGSCYAFATVGVSEGVMLRKNDTRRLSVQQIIDCSTANQGCAGGDPLLGLRYVKTTGLSKDSSYPYTAKQGRCKSFKAISNVSSVNRVTLNGDEKRLKDIVAAHGPVAVGINAADSLMNYMSGVYTNPRCSKKYDHAVLLTGYGTDPKFGDYWIVKNSWGTTWGEQGYVRMARNQKGMKNMCGIANTVWYAS